jgi:hypothetical protein
LLELDGGVKVLIDVGWDESFDADKLKELEKYVYWLLTEDTGWVAYRSDMPPSLCLVRTNSEHLGMSQRYH